MPTYVYECSSCNKSFEVEQRITEDPIKDCICGSQGTVKRIIQPTAIMFKGSGFYVNDSNKASTSEAKSEESVTESAPATSETTTTSSTSTE